MIVRDAESSAIADGLPGGCGPEPEGEGRWSGG